jgi:hypothetical protein
VERPTARMLCQLTYERFPAKILFVHVVVVVVVVGVVVVLVWFFPWHLFFSN